MGSQALATSLLSSFQASVSVLLTLSYGALAAYFRLIDSHAAQSISSLCVNLLLPALLITNIGSELSPDNFTNYVPIFVWSLVYIVISTALGVAMRKGFGLPRWVVPACAFNNTTSLPLLLTKSLASTGIFEKIGGKDASAAVDRANSYFLVNSMLSNALVFSLGPKLLGTPPERCNEDEESQSSHSGEQSDEDNPEESSPLLVRKAHRAEAKLPEPVQEILGFNPTLIAGVIALVIALSPPLTYAFFAKSGPLSAWLTSSLRNIGDLFTALQVFVVGSKLFGAFASSVIPDRSFCISFALVFLLRFLAWGAVSVPIVYTLAAKTDLLGSDPVLWWCMCLMPVGPPAMILSALTDVADEDEEGKESVAKLLAGMYTVTPSFFVVVVWALKACETIMDVRN